MALQSTIFRAFLALLFSTLAYARFFPRSFVAIRAEEPSQLSDNTTLTKRVPIEGGQVPCAPGEITGDLTIQNQPQPFDAEAMDLDCIMLPSMQDLQRAAGMAAGDPPPADDNVPPPTGPGPIRELYNALLPEQRIPTDTSGITQWTINGQLNTDSTRGTSDLCGCTVVLVTSPFACVMAHVLESRADDNPNWDNPESEGQQARDVVWVEHGVELVDQMLNRFTNDELPDAPTLENSFNGFFPADQTSVTVIAPAWNPDYYRQWPAALNMQRGEWIFPNQVGRLGVAIADRVVNGGYDRVVSVGYRRRYWNTDPMHRSDGRDLVVVAPISRSDGRVEAVAFYDDTEQITLVRIADPRPQEEGGGEETTTTTAAPA